MTRSRRILVTGLSTYWGGRLAETLENDPEVEVIIGVDSRDPTRELERTEFVRVGTQHALIRRIVQAARIDTVIDTRLIVDSINASSRDAHENNVIGTMNILAACGGATRRSASSSSSPRRTGTAASRTTRPSSPRTWPAPPAAHAHRARHRRGRGAVAGVRRAQPRHDRDDPALLQRPGAGPEHVPQPTALAAGGAHDPRVRPALPVHPRGRHRRLPGARAAPGPRRGSTTAPPTACSCSRRSSTCSARRCSPSCRHGGRAWPPASCAAPGCGSRPRCSTRCASAAAWTTASSRRGLPLPLHDARDRHRAARAPAHGAPRCATGRAPTATSARWRSSCAGARACRRRAAPSPGRAPGHRRGSSRRRANGRSPRAPAAARGRRPPAAEYDELEEDEVIGMLGALEREDLEALRRYEVAGRARPRVVRSIDAVLAAQAAARGHSPPRGRPPGLRQRRGGAPLWREPSKPATLHARVQT